MKKKFFPLFALIAAGNLEAEDRHAAAAAYVQEAPLPRGWPAPGPYDQVVERRYPACRAAFTNGKGEISAFATVAAHMRRHDIPMKTRIGSRTEGEAVGPRHDDVTFLHPNGRIGPRGSDGPKVEVREVPAATALSYAWLGSDSKINLAAARSALEEALAERNAEAASFRLLGYNDPGTPRDRQTWELQAVLD